MILTSLQIFRNRLRTAEPSQIVQHADGAFHREGGSSEVPILKRKNLADLIEIPRIDVSSISQVPAGFGDSWPDAPVVRCKPENPTTTQSAPVIDIMRAVAKFLKSSHSPPP